MRLVPDCLPEMHVDDVDLTTNLLGRRLSAPVLITGMTGGHPKAAELNERLARVAARYGVAMGLGSQRAGLASDDLMKTYRAAREAAPDAFLIANIGAPQLVAQGDRAGLSLDEIEHLVDSIGAQALAIHLNFAQEIVQPEGDRNASGCLAAIARVVESIGVPVLVKETGAGIDMRRAADLAKLGVAAIDVGGSGGTSMVRIEGARTGAGGSGLSTRAAAFDGWGIPTAASVLEARGCGVPIIATGGVRSGVDAARAIALGAAAVGVGLPFLTAADAGETELDGVVDEFIEELRLALFLTGSRTPPDLVDRGAVILGDLRVWAEQRRIFPVIEFVHSGRGSSVGRARD